MGRRSPTNPRYRKDAQVGSTRRSSASAKPKREAGEAPRKPSGSGKGGKGVKGSRVPLEPETPEFKRWRKIWLGLLIAAMLFSVSSFAWRDTIVGNLSLGFAYSCLFAALWIDFTKIRRMRKEWREQQVGGSGKSKKVTDTKEAEDSSDENATS